MSVPSRASCAPLGLTGGAALIRGFASLTPGYCSCRPCRDLDSQKEFDHKERKERTEKGD